MPHFSSESRDRLAGSIMAHNYRVVAEETWGHLAPEKNTAYRGVIRFAVGVFGNDELNPTPIQCEFKNLDTSPWFYDALTEFLYDLAKNNPTVEAGGVYEWQGAFRNYEFKGTVRRMNLS